MNFLPARFRGSVELAIAIISALVTIAGLVFKMWKQKKDVAVLEVDNEQLQLKVEGLGKLLGKTATQLVTKERELRVIEQKFAEKLSAAELAAELNKLRKPPTGSGDA